MRNECLEKVTKYELSILRRLAMAQEKPEGGPKRPPHAPNRVKMGPGCYVMKGFACQKVCLKIFNIVYCFVPKMKSTP